MIIFTASVVEINFEITAFTDAVLENLESYVVLIDKISLPKRVEVCSIPDSSAAVSIIDQTDGVIKFQPVVYGVTEGGFVTLMLQLSTLLDPSVTVTVNIVLLNGTAVGKP